MNPPWPRRTVLTRTALLAPGRTTTSPALTSPAKTTSSTNDDNTAGDHRLHPYRKRDMYGTCTAGGSPVAGCRELRVGEPACGPGLARGAPDQCGRTRHAAWRGSRDAPADALDEAFG